MSAEVVRLHGVVVSYDGAAVLRGIEWTASRGENWVIVGPNGAGKTTLLQVVAGLVPVSAGTVEILGEPTHGIDPDDLAELRSRVGMTSAAVADMIRPRDKVIDLVLAASYGILGRGAEEYDSGDLARAADLLDAVGCAHLIRRRFGTLSEGERKRVQIARSLMADPELLLLDEPAAGLDPAARYDLLGRLGALAGSPKAPAIVLVTHHVEEVPEGFTHTMLLAGGEVVAAGPVPEAFTSANLSECFGVALVADYDAGRWLARMASSRE